jgi:transcription antitermination factor NusG
MGSLQTSRQFVSQGAPHASGVQGLCQVDDYPRWCAVFTLTRHEKRANAQCEQRQIESFLPLYKVQHRWKNRTTVDVELPLFASYFFVRIDPRKRVQVLQIPGVVSIVSSGHQPLPLPDDYIHFLRDGLLAHAIEPHPNVEVGEVVRIKTGPMTGVEGVLSRRKNDLRVIVKLELLARSVSVEVGAEEIERCHTRTFYS